MSDNKVLRKIRNEIIDCGKDTRYKLGGYTFVLNGLEYFLTGLGEKRHVTGQELSAGLAEFAYTQYGVMAHDTLHHWGIESTNDFGYVVYNLIAIELMSRREEDSLEDFFGVFDLADYFRNKEPFKIDFEYVRRVRGA
ncbi:MAG: hypothetical protein GF398_20930 [Chitinivibrionales bacterium]|nr:hypothetical protein [Chitinivibrionales bacterium]